MISLHANNAQRGFTMIEVLITLIILAFGILGLANLQGKMHITSMESYQRSQAYLLLQDMVNRINANYANAAAYVTGPAAPWGVGDAQPTDCSALAVGVARDACEWSNALKGAAEQAAGNNVGAMIGARGCVELIQAPIATPGVCTPGSYRVSVVWQGLNQTGASALSCAQGSDYGGDSYRRVMSTVVVVGLMTCS